MSFPFNSNLTLDEQLRAFESANLPRDFIDWLERLSSLEALSDAKCLIENLEFENQALIDDVSRLEIRIDELEEKIKELESV